MTTLTVKMPEALRARLRDEAGERGVNCSELVRRAVEELLSAGQKPAAGSCLSRAGALAGCLKGTRDMATHPRHMEGFGQ